MPSAGRTQASPLRLALLAAGALWPLLLAACGDPAPAAPPPPPCDAPPVVTAAAGQAWQLFGPADWSPGCSTLTVRAPALEANERLALVLVNAGGPDFATASILLDAATFAAVDLAPVVDLAPLASLAAATPLEAVADEPAVDQAAVAAGNAFVAERRRDAMRVVLAEGSLRGEAAPASRLLAAAAAPAPALGSRRPFCVDKLTTVARQPEARMATLQHVTPHALYYVTDDVWPQMKALLESRVADPADRWLDFEDYYEGSSLGTRNASGSKRILPALTESFGVGTDYDRNGRQIFLFANLVKYFPATSTSIIVGLFDANDLRPADPGLQLATPECSGSGSNGGDVLYLLDPATGVAKNWPLNKLLDELLPGTMAHELQHNVIANARCFLPPGGPLPSCGGLDDPAGDLWLNEGLSMAAEDFAGFGMHLPTERSTVAGYLRTYQGFSLTTWPCTACAEVDPVGQYGGAHAFTRWLFDQAADPSAAASALVASSQASRAAVATVVGLPFEEAFSRFAAAALFSGEELMFTSYAGYPLTTPAPDFSYAPTPAPWAPLHSAVGRPKFTALPVAADPAAPHLAQLRRDGWGAFVTRFGKSAEATLTITSNAGVKPRVAVVRFKGTLLQP